MPLAEQFELLELIQRDKAETWLAVEKTTSRRLLLHRFREDTGLRQRLLSMGPDDLIMLVGAEREGAFYVVVTHDLPPLRAFSTWVQERSDAASSKAAVSAPAPPLQWEQKGESFDPDRTQLMAPRVAGSNSAAPPFESNAEPRSDGPGDFTRLFAASPVSPAEQKPAPPLKSETGEFTRMFEAFPAASEHTEVHRAEPEKATRVPPAAPPPKAEPGEFTKLFYAPPKPAGEGSEPAFPPTAKPKLKSDSTGEFTRMFENPFVTPVEREKTQFPALAASPPAPTPPKNSEGDFTRMFSSLSQTGAEEQRPKFDSRGATGIFDKPQSLRGPGQSTTPTPAGPSDYTRLFQGTTPAAESAAAPAAEKPKSNEEEKAPAPTAPNASKNAILLVVVLALLLMAALALLLYFFLKR